MKWITRYPHPKGWAFTIEHELVSGSAPGGPIETDFYYLIGSDAEGNEFCNYMQEALDAAMVQAEQDFGVPVDSWAEVKPEA